MKLRDLLRELPIPEQEEARRRSFAVVRAAFAEREPVRQRTHYLKPALALAVVAAVVAAAASPPGRAVLGSLRKTVAGEKRAAPELFTLPSGGRPLVNSSHGPWSEFTSSRPPDGSRKSSGAARFSPATVFLSEPRTACPGGLPAAAATAAIATNASAGLR